MLLAAFVSPFWGYVCNQSKQVIHRSVVFNVLCHSLRLPKSLAEGVSRLLLAAQEILKVNRLLVQLVGTCHVGTQHDVRVLAGHLHLLSLSSSVVIPYPSNG